MRSPDDILNSIETKWHNKLLGELRDVINFGRCTDEFVATHLTTGTKTNEDGEPLPYKLNDLGYAVVRKLFIRNQ